MVFISLSSCAKRALICCSSSLSGIDFWSFSYSISFLYHNRLTWREHKTLTRWPISRQCEIPWRFTALGWSSVTHITPALVLTTRMDANMHLTINSFRQLFPDKIFSSTVPWLLVKSLTFPWQLSNSPTFPGFPDKRSPWTKHCMCSESANLHHGSCHVSQRSAVAPSRESAYIVSCCIYIWQR